MQEITPFELESRLGRACSMSTVQSLNSLSTALQELQECGSKLLQVSSQLNHNALQSLPDGPTSRPAYAYDSLLATAPSLPCDRTRSPGPSKGRKSEVFMHSVRKGDTSPIRRTSTLKTNTLQSTPVRRMQVPAQTISTRVYASGYPVDALSKSMNPRNATPTTTTRECRTPMVPLHTLGSRDFNVPTQSVLVHQSNQTLGHHTVTYRHDVHWQSGATRQPAQRIQRSVSLRETLSGAWPLTHVTRY